MKIDRLFVVSLGAITGLASCSSGQEEEAQRPNILILLADDAGYADFGFMGATDIQTPNIDRLAAEGCIFMDAHVAATVSSPSRSMMLTGRYGQRYGYECNLDKPGDGLPDDEELLPALLKRYDYRTGCIGKWHLGSEPSQRPNAKGFDTFYGLLAGHRSYFYNPETSDKDGNLQQYQHNGRKLSFDGYFTDELASKAQQFVTESEQPFMLYMSFTAPHSPNEATEEDLARFEGQPRQKYAALMYALDRGVDSVLYNMDQDVEEMQDRVSSEPEKARALMEPVSEGAQACCKDPLWIEEGWAEITNGLHERLMKNEIRTAQDL